MQGKDRRLDKTNVGLDRRTVLKTIAGAAATPVSVGLSLTGSGVTLAAEKKITVGAAWPGVQDVAWATAKKLIQEYGAKSNPPIEIVFTVADMDVAKQASDVQDLINKGVDAVLVFPIDAKAISSSIKACHDAHIPVMAFLRQVYADAKYQADVFVGIDAKWQEYSAGRAVLAKMKKDNVPVKGLLWVSGDPRDENSRLRGLGLEEAANEVGVKILQTLPSNWDPQQAAARLAPALKAYPDANVLALASDILIPGVQKVLEDAGKWHPYGHPDHMYLISVDFIKPGIDAMRGKYVDADTPFDVPGMSQKAIELLPKLVAGEKLKDVLIQGPVATQENVGSPEIEAHVWDKG